MKSMVHTKKECWFVIHMQTADVWMHLRNHERASAGCVTVQHTHESSIKRSSNIAEKQQGAAPLGRTESSGERKKQYAASSGRSVVSGERKKQYAATTGRSVARGEQTRSTALRRCSWGPKRVPFGPCYCCSFSRNAEQDAVVVTHCAVSCCEAPSTFGGDMASTG
jgi:hypothetical protein